MAEGILRQRWSQTDREALVVSSMGTHGLDHEPASELAQKVCRDHGIDISDHRSRSMTGEELQTADLVLCMEKMHKEHVQTFFPWHRDRVFLLAAWPGRETRRSVIRDPIGGSESRYRQVFETIHGHVDRILPLL